MRNNSVRPKEEFPCEKLRFLRWFKIDDFQSNINFIFLCILFFRNKLIYELKEIALQKLPLYYLHYVI